MSLPRRIGAAALNFVVLLALFLGSCAGPAIMYVRSPWWFLEDIGPGGAGTFFVAYTAKDDAAHQNVKFLRYDFKADAKAQADMQFHLPNGEFQASSGGEDRGRVTARADGKGGQLVKVFVTGDTMWTSLSEYRVEGNRIYPLRHAHSVGWFLLAALVLPLLIYSLRNTIRRAINRMMRVDPA